MSSYEPIVALQRGLEVLAFVNQERSVSLKVLHEQTGLHKATLIRMLETLIASGYVAKTGRSVYVPTGRVLRLSQGYDVTTRIGDITSTILSEFRTWIGWPSDIAIYNNGGMLVAQSSRDRAPMHFVRRKGYRAPMLVTSLGEAYLAFCSAETRHAIIEELASSNEPRNERARDPQVLERELAEIRSRGYATMHRSYSDQEYRGKVWGLAVPIRDSAFLYASINILFLKESSPERETIARFLQPLQTVAARLAEAIGAETSGVPLEVTQVAQ